MTTTTTIACPVCGSNTVPHCDPTAKHKGNRDCTWWRCPNKNCNSFGYNAHRYVDNRGAR